MKEKFQNIPVEKDTQILLSFETKLGDLDAVYQKWYWSGIHAESLILYNEDVPNLTEKEAFKKVAQDTALLKDNSQLTYKKGDTYTFINFNFERD